jgi:hypothetical protein
LPFGQDGFAASALGVSFKGENVKIFWNRLESNPRFFAFFWGALGSFAVWLIVEHSGNALLFLGNGVLSGLTGYIDSRYQKAAILQNTEYSYFILSFIFVIVAVAWSEISSNITSDLKQKKVKVDKKKDKPLPKWAPLVFLIAKLLIWFYLLFGLLFLSGESIVLNATSDFKQHVRIIAPYINEQKEEELLSEWSLMQSADDYNEVYKTIIEIAKDNSLILKKNRHY